MLVAFTPARTISFVSKALGGSMSGKELVKGSGIVDLFSPGEILLAERSLIYKSLFFTKV